MKYIKYIIYIFFILYIFTFIYIFLYFSNKLGVKDSLSIVDNLLVSGPVKRMASPIISDKEMIVLFEENRDLFENTAIKIKEKCIEGNNFYDIKNKINLIDIKSGYPITGYWFPEPYSANSIDQHYQINKKFKLLINKRNEEWKFSAEGKKLGHLSTPPDWLEWLTEVEKKRNLELGGCRYRSIGFFFKKYNYDSAVKGWVYIPEEPKIVDNFIKIPGEKTTGYAEVLLGLDFVLGFYRDTEKCHFRQIESNWFIFVCPYRH